MHSAWAALALLTIGGCDGPERKALASNRVENRVESRVESRDESAQPKPSGAAPTSASVAPASVTPRQPWCDAPFDQPTPEQRWTRASSALVRKVGPPNHRGRDLIVGTTEPQWLIAKLAYGFVDKDLEGEAVHVFVLRDCKRWEPLGEATSSRGSEHEPKEGAEDAGGRVFFEVPEEKRLGRGSHRVRFVVDGDASTADLIVEVVDKARPIFVTDVDGTLTKGEMDELPAVLEGEQPDVHPDAAAAMAKLAAKGMLPVYVTARPEWLMSRTRQLLEGKGFPRGIVTTSTTATGAIGHYGATSYKTDVLARLMAHGCAIQWAFGNLGSDAQAYEAAGIEPLNHRVFFQYTDRKHGGRRIEQYRELLDDPSF